ncbi:MAG: peptidoglycan editing factor PgeF [Cycloclasticus sp.]
MPKRFVVPNWPAPKQVKALTTCRNGGVSVDAYSSFNLGRHVDDDASAVTSNRTALVAALELPADPVWLDQAHGVNVVELDQFNKQTTHQADASLSRTQGLVCAVLTADCLPVLLCKQDGSAVAAVHAGWRGLLSGVIEKTIAALGDTEQILAWLGPAIGPGRFEVGAEVKEAFVKKNTVMQQAFRQTDEAHHLADLYALARMTLIQYGVKRIYGGEHCTYNEADKFYSYRREPVTGRMASLIWLQP